MNKRIIICIAILFIYGCFHAQNNRIKGVITDSVSKEAIPGVSVLIDGINRSASTNALGKFDLAGLADGNYKLKIFNLGFEPTIIDVNLYGNETKEISIQLKPSIIKLSEVTISQTSNIGDAMSVMNQLDKKLRPTNSAQDLLRLVPGLFIAQHAGGGKAEQIFLRGFDVDHGTDFFVSIDGIPVNMVSHAHGHGYADFHFVIPETVEKLQVYKGPYAAKFGDFATSGAGEFTTKNDISKSLIKLEYGQFDTYRAVAVIDVLRGKHIFSKQKENAYIAAEYNFTNAYFQSPQNFKRINVFAKYSGVISEKNFLSFSASTFLSSWNASGQIPDRAVKEGMINRFGSID
ncbi:MAG: TonB-dependent receptor, partial [Bacteroidia bacterium]|nr:TonB-dependent receptor [Bacteroidia bacterium]